MAADPLYRRITLPSGRYRYIPSGVPHYDVLPIGHHLIHVAPGCTTTRYGVNPDHAAVLAAVHAHRDILTAAVCAAMSARPSRYPLMPEQARAWDALQATGVHLVTEGASTVVDRLAAAVCEAMKKG